uniref:Clc-like protein n=1 Tax=Caenorhabditis japonica TaxID=281687 RepID=A0A8R1HP24_CAEJA
MKKHSDGMIDASSEKCGRKTVLTIHFTLSFIAFLLCLLALISPSWHQVNLENGRTEHHHGLWLDCKRDYSFDYGRSRDYYETLYRRDLQGSPFSAFYLPQLQCVYKFDYYIDQEDLYDHNHDENKIQNDAYQHLFLGWKIAALVGVSVGVIFAACSVLMGICAFCHRSFICACTVIITIASILSILGSGIFYFWGNTQDNKVIKEEEENETYEQVLGWAFYCHLLGTFLLGFCSVMGCCLTSISTGKGSSQLVSIKLVENDNESELLSSNGQNFKRSFSAVYKVDSAALRQWERSYLKNVIANSSDIEQTFKRTASVPNFSKNNAKRQTNRHKRQQSGADFFSSTSNFTEVTHFDSNTSINAVQRKNAAQRSFQDISSTLESAPASKPLKSALKTPSQSRRDMTALEPAGNTYEYCKSQYDASTIGVSSFLGSQNPITPSHQYDEVYETIPGEEYLEPKSVRNNRISNSTITTTDLNQSWKLLDEKTAPFRESSQSIPAPKVQKTTVLDDVAQLSSLSNKSLDNCYRDIKWTQEKTSIEREEKKQFTMTNRLPPPPVLPVKPKNIREFGIDLSKENIGSWELGARLPQAPIPFKDEIAGKIYLDEHEDISSSPEIALNTFSEKQKSITNLSFRGILRGPSAAEQIFDRRESRISASPSLGSELNNQPLSLVNQRLIKVLPDEVDRSVGSSTIFENEFRDSPSSYAQDAEVRLNLFMKDTKNDQGETTV